MRTIAAAVATATFAGGLAGLSPAVPSSAAPRVALPGRLVVATFGSSGIVSMLPDGSDRQWVLHVRTDVLGGVAVTSDGSSIAAAIADHKARHIFTVKPDGSDYTQLTSGVHHDNEPTFSPGGGSIAFSRVRRRGQTSLMRMKSDGSHLTNLSDPGEPQPWSQAWSPDGQYIALVTNTALVLTDPHGTWYRYLITVDPTKTVLISVGWSPDSSTIVYSVSRISNHRHTGDLFGIGVDGKHRQRLTDTPRLDEYSASFSPDGTALACIVLFPRSGGDVVVMNPDGSHRTRFQTKVWETELAWGG